MHFNGSNQKSAEYYIDGRLGSFTYGTEPVSPLDLASAYATIAARGTQCDPVPLTQILNSDGQPLTGDDGQPVVKADNCTPEVIAPGIADTLNQMLRKDVEPGSPMQTAPRAYIPGHQIAGKTGTVNNNDSVAFVGSTPEYTASAMVFRPLGIQSVGGFGGGKAATIWHDAMAPILTNQPTAEFPPADPAFAGSRGVDGVPPVSAPRPNTGGGSTPSPSDPQRPAPPAPSPPPPADPGAPALPPDTNGDGQPG
jgi:membrane peptidoglycan carboxypeptidase